jgi:hypothetical protein
MTNQIQTIRAGPNRRIFGLVSPSRPNIRPAKAKDEYEGFS